MRVVSDNPPKPVELEVDVEYGASNAVELAWDKAEEWRDIEYQSLVQNMQRSPRNFYDNLSDSASIRLAGFTDPENTENLDG